MAAKYEPTAAETASVNNIFTYHRPHGDQPERYEKIRVDFRLLAHTLQMLCPPGRERSLAITHLQQACMCANAAIAIGEKPPEGGIE
jgi:hypothetical protein